MMKLRIAAVAAVAALAFAQSAPPKPFKLEGNRFKPLTWEQMDPAQKKMISNLLTGERGGTGGPFNVTLRAPEMGDIAQNLGAYIRYHSSLPRKLNEFAIIITGRYWNSQYEFYAHRPLAVAAGLNESIANAVAENKRPTGMSADETIIYDFATEMLNTKKVSDAHYKAVVDKFGERGAVDLTGVMGYYGFVSMMLNLDGYPLPAGAAPLLK